MAQGLQNDGARPYSTLPGNEESVMIHTIQEQTELEVAISDAENAADWARRASDAAVEWIAGSGLAGDDATEAMFAAWRAAGAAARARRATSLDQAWKEAATAWAAADTALEADARVVAAFAAALATP